MLNIENTSQSKLRKKLLTELFSKSDIESLVFANKNRADDFARVSGDIVVYTTGKRKGLDKKRHIVSTTNHTISYKDD